MRIYKDHSLQSHKVVIDRYCKSIVHTKARTYHNYQFNTPTFAEQRTECVKQIKEKNRVKEQGVERKNLQGLPSDGTLFSDRQFRMPQQEHIKKKSHVHKSHRTVKKLTQLINLMYEYRNKKNKLYWVTITTVQHQTKRSDKELFYALKLWLQHRRVSYICVAERQRETGDLHFHLIMSQSKDFDLPVECKRLSALFGTPTHPARFDAKHVFNVARLTTYIAKYVRKPCPSNETMQKNWERKDQINPKTNKPYGFKYPYSSIFECRTFSCSNDISRQYKENSDKFKLTIPVESIQLYPHLFQKRFETDYYTVYDFNIEVWALASAIHKRRKAEIERQNKNVGIIVEYVPC